MIKIYVFFLSLLKVKKNRILLHQPFKYGYDCNPKYIAEEILRRNKNYQLIWATRVNMAKNGDFPAKIRLVTNKFILLYYFSTSVCCISNSYLGLSNYNLKKKKGQTFINTWHGSLGIKRIGETEENRLYNKKMLDWVDIFISNSDFESEVYRKSLLFEKTIYELGHQKNNVFFVDSYYNPDRPKIKVAVENFLNRKIDNKKLILYAPTFREIDRTDCFNLDYNFLIPRLPLYMDSRIKKINDDEVVVCKITEDLGLTLFNNQNIKIGEIKTELDLFDVLTQVKRKRLEGFYAIDKDNRKHEITRHGTIIGLNSDKRLYEKYLKEIMGF